MFNLPLADADRECYESHLREWLPAELIDVHTHVWLARFSHRDPEAAKRVVSWPAMVAKEGPIEDLIATYQLMFPGKRVNPVIFGNALSDADDMAGGNAYVAECARKHDFPALLFATPKWNAGEFEERMLAGGFVGMKVYLTHAPAYLPTREIRIFDFLPPHQLEVLDRHGWIAMLHVPRDGRLRDPVNLAQMLEIEQRYPNLKLIIAHVGRAYCPEDVGNAFEVLAKTQRMLFDFSANTNADVFRRLLETVGPQRVLFGSDLPITRMRMRRICENGHYVNLVPRGLYGDVSGDSHMREVEAPEASQLTFFLYEEIKAFRQAAEAVGLSRHDIADVFCNNARKILGNPKP